MIKTEKKIVEELSKIGFDYYDLNAVSTKQNLEIKEVEILLKWLARLYDEHLGEAGLATRCLVNAKDKFNPEVLLKLFERKDFDFSTKSVIGFTIIKAKTIDISEWIKNQLLHTEFGLEKISLVWGLPRKKIFKGQEDLMHFLTLIFDKYANTDEFLNLIKRFATKRDLPFLVAKVEIIDPKKIKLYNKIILNIGSRDTSL